MNKLKDTFYTRQSTLYKLTIFVLATAAIVYFFPKKGKFKYEFSKGKPWQYENLYAPFDFAVLKSEDVLQEEKNRIKENSISYFDYKETVSTSIFENLEKDFLANFSNEPVVANRKKLYRFVKKTLTKVYENGILEQDYDFSNQKVVYLKKNNQVTETTFGKLYSIADVTDFIKTQVKKEYPNKEEALLFFFFEIIKPNVSLNESLTQKALDEELSKVLDTRGSVEKDRRIIARGEVIDEQSFQVLKSLQLQFEAQIWSQNNQNWIVLGYIILVGIAMAMLLLFIRKYMPDIYENNTKITFIVFNILLIVVLTTLVIDYDPKYVYAVPICILPLVIKAFFDARLGLFTHVIAVLILGVVVPNGYEFIFIQIIVGVVTVLTVSELYKRANLFITVGQITLVYILSYTAFHLIQEGGINQLEELNTIFLFILGGFMTLIVHPLIYGYEKIFGLVSDVSLLELSDTNSKLLKELSEKAPGTFHHSMNVANIAEAAANEIGANAMLIRVGALYHDIGKMHNPTFFTENQKNGLNPHDHLLPTESAKIIIGHSLKGIEIAKKNNLPDRVIDFIRTHHGTSSVYYFYMKAKEEDPDIDIELFKYPGPIPFSKETAILMMSDSVEAASKSLKNPTSTLIDEFVEKIINKQMDEGQFLNADITFKEIQQIKKVMKRKLNNMYHLRIEYPE